jgi:polyphosphate:AMP phosphotransferase
MFESAELGHKLSKKDYAAREAQLRGDLLDVQFELGQRKAFPVIILVNGVDGAGKGETVNLLNEWMDPRHIQTHAFGAPSDEDRNHPFMWRFWRALPPRGKIGILFGNWYTQPILDRVSRLTSNSGLESALDELNHFEQMLTHEGALLVKFWFHLSKEAQRKRLRALEKDPHNHWRVTQTDWERFAQYDRYRKVSEHVLRHTSTGPAPWVVLEGADDRYRSVSVGEALLAAVRKRLDAHEKGYKPRVVAPPLPARNLDNRDILNSLVLRQEYSKAEYEKAVEKYQARLNKLTRDKGFNKRSLVVVFEGNDAAGKGGAVRRVTQALDARWYHVIPVAAPTEEERAQPYLWRFWRHMPRMGRVAMFDRSWYGRVLVERVEGFCAEADWMRAYAEINDFEEQLTRAGVVVAKFWMAISPEEQLKRFKEREKTRFKRFKITPDDWRNRKKWPLYERAVCDMIDRTSTENAPWTLVEADNKYFARIKVLKTLCRQLEAAL